MNRKTLTMIGAGVAAAGLTFGAISIANADDTATSTPGVERGADDRPGRGHHGDETPLTGADAEKATAAAQAAVPDGTVMRVEADNDGEATYEAHVRKADGTHVVVLMDADFNVTGVEDRPGPRGPRGDWTPLTGADAEKATAAAQAAVPDGTVMHVFADKDGQSPYVAHVRKADGTHVAVLMDADFKVTGVEERPEPGPRGPRWLQGDEEPLTGAEAEQAIAAAQAAVQDGDVLGVGSASDGTYRAIVRKTDGTIVAVRMDGDFKVTSVEERDGRGPRGERGPRGGGSEGNGSNAQSSSFIGA